MLAEEEKGVEKGNEEGEAPVAALVEVFTTCEYWSGKRTVRHWLERRHSPRAFTPAAFPAAVSLWPMRMVYDDEDDEDGNEDVDDTGAALIVPSTVLDEDCITSRQCRTSKVVAALTSLQKNRLTTVLGSNITLMKEGVAFPPPLLLLPLLVLPLVLVSGGFFLALPTNKSS